MLVCDRCGSSIPEERWKKQESNGVFECPVCGAQKVRETSSDKVISEGDITLLKESDNNLSKELDNKSISLSFVKEDGSTNIPEASDVLRAVDSGVRHIFGDAITACPECGHVICVCSLKRLFAGDNNIGF